MMRRDLMRFRRIAVTVLATVLAFADISMPTDNAHKANTLTVASINNKLDSVESTESLSESVLAEYIDQYSETAGLVKVAVLDTGYTGNSNRIDYSGSNFSNEGDQQSVADLNGHGTKVINTVLEETSENVEVIPIKIADSKGEATISACTKAVEEAQALGADVINISMETSNTNNALQLKNAIANARSNGILTVVAAGNDGSVVSGTAPACFNESIAVSAMSNSGVLMSFSNYGDVDYSAIGEDGTSFAAARVSAAFAELKAVHPLYSVDKLISLMDSLSQDLGNRGADQFYGRGFVSKCSVFKSKYESVQHSASNTEKRSILRVAAVDYSTHPPVRYGTAVDEGYSNGYIRNYRKSEGTVKNLTAGTGVSTKKGSAINNDVESFRNITCYTGNNTSYDEAHSFVLKNAVRYVNASGDAKWYDLKVWIRTNNSSRPWALSTTNFKIYNFWAQTTYVKMRVLDGSSKLEFKGMTCISDLDDGEAIALHSGYANIYTTSDSKNVYTPKGTKNDNSSDNPYRGQTLNYPSLYGTYSSSSNIYDFQNVWVEIHTTSSKDFEYEYKTKGARGSDLFYTGYELNYVIGGETVDTFYCVRYGTIRLMKPSDLDHKPKGYTVSGWYKEAGCTNALGSKLEWGSGTSAKNIYGKKTPIKYSVAYKGNGSTSGSVSTQTECKYDSNVTIAANGFSRSYKVTLNANGGSCTTPSLVSNYTFTGWNTKTDGSGTKYSANEKYKNLTSSANGTVTLYAQWKKEAVTLPTPSRTGYTFKGWAESSSATTGITGAYKPTKAITLYAIWSPNTYTLTFNANGGNAPSSASIQAKYDAKWGTVATCTRRGYTFLGWFTAASGGTQVTTNTICKENQTVYAHWKVNQYNLTIKVRYQNVDGSYTAFSEKINRKYDYGSTVSWDSPETWEYFKVSVSYVISDADAVKEITVNRKQYTVTVDKDGGIASVSGANTYYAGTNVTISATRAFHYRFKTWTGDSTSTSSSFAVIVKSNLAYKATSELTPNNTIELEEDSRRVIYSEADLSYSVNVTKNLALDNSPIAGTLSIVSSDEDVATAEISSDSKSFRVYPKNVGTTTFTITSKETWDYHPGKITYTLTVINGTMKTRVYGYYGDYDGNAHALTPQVDLPGDGIDDFKGVEELSGISVMYSEENGKYNLSSLSYSMPGVYTVYYKIHKKNYNDVFGSKIVHINKLAGKVSLDKETLDLQYPSIDSFNVIENKSGGDLWVESSDISIASCTILGTEVEVSPNVEEGDAVITVHSSETALYNEATAFVVVSIKSGDLLVHTNGYNGAYDGKYHSISVTCEQPCEITYSQTAKGSYTEENPKFKDVGKYYVYYRIARPGYSVITNKQIVNITKANGILELDSYKGSVAFGNDMSVKVLQNSGPVITTVQNNDIVKCSVNDKELIISPLATGSTIIFVAASETDTHLSVEKQYEITVSEGTFQVTAIPYVGVYDGKEHSISLNVPADASVTYNCSSDDSDYSDYSADFVNAGYYTVRYKVSRPNYEDVIGESSVTINKAPSVLTFEKDSVDLTTPSSVSVGIVSNRAMADLKVTYSDASIVSAEISRNKLNIKSFVKASTCLITVSAPANNNYEAVSTTLHVNVGNPQLKINLTGYRGVYDGKEHTVSVSNANNAYVTYATTKNGLYSTAIPKFKNAGSYIVYVKASRNGYLDYFGSADVVISKASGYLRLGSNNGTIGRNNLQSVKIAENRSNGAISIAIDKTDLATVSISGKQLLFRTKNKSGKLTATVTSAETMNYKAATAKYTLTITTAKLQLSSKSYSGIYDGKKHSISVSCKGCTILYATTERGSYRSGNPRYSAIGSYRVYYKVMKSGIVLADGSEVVTIKDRPIKIASIENIPKKKIKISWNCVSNADGYQVQYSTTSNFKKARTVTIKSHSVISKTISDMQLRKRYYARVRYYRTVKGKRVYSDWSSSAKVNIKR